jgi:hypothetical protein
LNYLNSFETEKSINWDYFKQTVGLSAAHTFGKSMKIILLCFYEKLFQLLALVSKKYSSLIYGQSEPVASRKSKFSCYVEKEDRHFNSIEYGIEMVSKQISKLILISYVC